MGIGKFAGKAGLAVALFVGAALPASASSLFSFSYSETDGSGNLSGSGLFVGNSIGGGDYQLVGISGFATSTGGGAAAITGLSPYAAADNVLSFPVEPFVDFGGISFSTSVEDFNLYWNGYYGVLESSTNPVGYPNSVVVAFDVTSLGNAVAAPLPAALPLFAGGLGLVGLFARRKKRKDASPATA